MREAVIVASSRTPLAKSFRGSFNLTRPDDLAAHCIRDVLRKVPQLNPAEIEDVFMGCGFPEGTQGMNVARVAAIRAGLPVSVAAATVNRFCSSGLQSIANRRPPALRDPSYPEDSRVWHLSAASSLSALPVSFSERKKTTHG